MTECSTDLTTYRCPITVDEVMEIICALLPQGFAWDAVDDPDTVMHKYWRVMARQWVEFHARTCQLLEERYCDTASETLDDWRRNFIPELSCLDEIDLCSRIQNIPRDSCEYYTALAASLGYEIECSLGGIQDCDDCTSGGMGNMRFGHGTFCAVQSVFLNIVLLVPGAQTPVCEGIAIFNQTGMGCDSACPPQAPVPEDLVCALEESAPAHIPIEITVRTV